mmetsp:Transcript_42045/g.65741  ORF Transcript_42045/g.65741 Transcript_42045/m.65741 type:complete len:93 (+) Transcript_42045:2408-2686(+)
MVPTLIREVLRCNDAWQIGLRKRCCAAGVFASSQQNHRGPTLVDEEPWLQVLLEMLPVPATQDACPNPRVHLLSGLLRLDKLSGRFAYCVGQ